MYVLASFEPVRNGAVFKKCHVTSLVGKFPAPLTGSVFICLCIYGCVQLIIYENVIDKEKHLYFTKARITLHLHNGCYLNSRWTCVYFVIVMETFLNSSKVG